MVVPTLDNRLLKRRPDIRHGTRHVFFTEYIHPHQFRRFRRCEFIRYRRSLYPTSLCTSLSLSLLIKTNDLQLTDPGQAHQDFVSTRLNNVDTTSDPQYALLPASEQQSSGTGSPANPDPSNEMTKTKNKITSAGKKIGKVVLIAIVAGAALLLITLLVCFFVCCRKRGGKNQRMMSGLGMSGVGFKGTEVPMPPNQPGMGMGGTYAPISYPAPQSHAPQYGGYGYTQY